MVSYLLSSCSHCPSSYEGGTRCGEGWWVFQKRERFKPLESLHSGWAWLLPERAPNTDYQKARHCECPINPSCPPERENCASSFHEDIFLCRIFKLERIVKDILPSSSFVGEEPRTKSLLRSAQNLTVWAPKSSVPNEGLRSISQTQENNPGTSLVVQ